MSTWNHHLGRAAVRLHAAYAAARESPPTLLLPVISWQDAQASLHRLSTAQRRGWTKAADCERDSLASTLEHLERCIRDLLVACRPKRDRSLPTLRLLYDELAAAEAEFGGVELEHSTITVTTEPITLEDVVLGPFQICLHLDRIGTDSPYTVAALEPNPAASSEETTHPHVSNERLCSGEGRSAINAALADGRLGDFFTIVNRILHTYTEGSAFVELDRWHGTPCHDCDCMLNEDEAGSCYHCEERVCGECLISCGGCGDGYCCGCIDRCARCEEHSCSGCLLRCRSCRRQVCAACREEDLCETCREELEEEHAEEELETTTTESPDASAKPAV